MSLDPLTVISVAAVLLGLAGLARLFVGGNASSTGQISSHTLLEERVAASGRGKAVLYRRADGLMLVKGYRWVEETSGTSGWQEVGGTSYVDSGSAERVLNERLAHVAALG
jgi:hypothetical protein